MYAMMMFHCSVVLLFGTEVTNGVVTNLGKISIRAFCDITKGSFQELSVEAQTFGNLNQGTKAQQLLPDKVDTHYCLFIRFETC